MARILTPEEQEFLKVSPGKYHAFNNLPYIDMCFKSIKDGDPYYIEYGKSIKGVSFKTISCLEHILENIFTTGSIESKSDLSVNPKIFEYLADPELNLESDLCSGGSCVPKIIDAYSALRQYKNPLSNPDGSPISRSESATKKKGALTDETFEKVISDVQLVINKYPHYLKKNACRHRKSSEMMNCFDAIISQNNNWRVIDLYEVPEDFLDGVKCEYMSTSDGYSFRDADNKTKFKDTHLLMCYEKLIRLAIRNSTPGKHTVSTAYASSMLTRMLESGRFDRQLIEESDNCDYSNIDYKSCFNMLIDRIWRDGTSSPFKAVNTVTKRFTDTGVIDTSAWNSPFNGEKCSESAPLPPTNPTMPSQVGYKPKSINCLDLLFKRTMQYIPQSSTSLNDVTLPTENSAYHELRGLILSQPGFADNPCKIIDVMFDQEQGGNQSDEIIRDDLKRAFGYSDEPGDIYDKYKNLTTINCINDLYGMVAPREVNAFDMLVEKDIPMWALVVTSTDVPMPGIILPLLNQENCNSIKTGNKINCLEKIATELLTDPSNNFASKILNRAQSAGGRGSVLRATESLSKSGRITKDDYVNLYSVKGVNVGGTGKVIDDYIIRALSDKVDDIKGGGKENMTHVIRDQIHEVMKRGVAHDPTPAANIFAWVEEKYGSGEGSNFVTYLAEIESRYGKIPEDVAVQTMTAAAKGLFTENTFPYVATFITRWYKTYGDGMKEVMKNAFIAQIGTDKPMGDVTFRYKVDKQLNETTKDPRYKRLMGTGGSQRHHSLGEFEKLAGIETKAGIVEDVKYEPTAEMRQAYDISCLKDVNGGKPYTGRKRFVQKIIDDPTYATTMRDDVHGIVGSYKVNAGGDVWSDNRMYRYSEALEAILLGKDYYIGEPYLENGKNLKVGLIDTFKKLSKSEPYGKRSDGTTATPVFKFLTTNPNSGSGRGAMKRDGNDLVITIEYRDDKTGATIEKLTKKFGYRDFMKFMPKKILTTIQSEDPVLFGVMQQVALKESTVGAAETYILNITNKPIDIARISSCNVWDNNSCMRLGNSGNRSEGGYSDTVNAYVDFGTYVAYLTKDSPYEPKWYARLMMHNCQRGGKPFLSVQNACNHYDIEGNYHKHWDIVYDAVQIILADAGVNAECNGNCDYLWYGKVNEDGYRYNDYTDESGCQTYRKNSNDYKEILKMRTGQDADSSLFVQKVLDTF